ncbi:alcohol dehydrogenase catalytic domain-containing protein [Haloarchaeobius litoreus]|uniref:Alcohol dehydrogenase catalytic domain-containing protein n=1 Tax=Haloarchaeobius litoreus TaxID=755306 RepID=A0ABD6DH49_9EURY|nr:alcohol dehydrogenase catalytic domain-containing protein [Haloarchaeobius litoreus]
MPSQRAVVLDEWGGELAVETVDRPEPAPGEVRVDVRACGVNRTIENAVQGGLSDDPGLTPRIPGHEFAGVVDAVGDGVDPDRVGEHVLAYFYLTCNECDACRRGDTNQCTDFGGWFGVNRDGAYAETAVLPAENALPLPDGASFAAGAVAADGVATPIHVCDRADVRDDDTVLVIGGAGRIGYHLAQVAGLRGAHVLAADVTDDRLAHAETAGEHVTAVDARGDNFAEALVAATPHGDGPTVVVDTVGDLDTLYDAWDALAMGGRVVSLTTHHDRAFDAPMKAYVVKEAAFIGSRYATRDEVVRAARLVADGRVDADAGESLSLDEVPDYHRRLRAGETSGTGVLVP